MRRRCPKGSLPLTVAERANTLAFLGRVHHPELEVDRIRPRDGSGGVVVRKGLGQQLGDYRRVHDAVRTVLDSRGSRVLYGFERSFTRAVREHVPETPTLGRPPDASCVEIQSVRFYIAQQFLLRSTTTVILFTCCWDGRFRLYDDNIRIPNRESRPNTYVII